MGKKILVVEDDNFIRDVYQDLLIEAGYQVTVAVDGEDGLTKAQVGGYDLILLDVMMPKMNGLKVLEELQKNPPKTANGSIVLLTNLAQDPIINDALKKGAEAYLIKSDLNPDQLLEKIKLYLS